MVRRNEVLWPALMIGCVGCSELGTTEDFGIPPGADASGSDDGKVEDSGTPPKTDGSTAEDGNTGCIVKALLPVDGKVPGCSQPADKITYTISFSNTAPALNQKVTCTVHVSNSGTITEGLRIAFSRQGMPPFHTSPKQIVMPGHTKSISAELDCTRSESVSISADLVCEDPLVGVQLLPKDNIFNTRIDTLPVHALSGTWISSIMKTDLPNPQRWLGHYNAHPINVVDNSIIPQALDFSHDHYASDEDILYPIPDYPLQVTDPNEYDKVLTIYNWDINYVYSLYHALYDTPLQKWYATQALWFDMSTNEIRLFPDGHGTDVPEFGLPYRYGEIHTGVINHAIQATVPRTDQSHVWPYFVYNGTGFTDHTNPPIGARLRLKASVDISSFKFEAKVVAQALKTYGLVITDQHNLDAPYIQIIGYAYPGWEVYGGSEMGDLDKLLITDFEGVDTDSLKIRDYSMQAKPPPP
jgi:hypothetical protein